MKNLRNDFARAAEVVAHISAKLATGLLFTAAGVGLMVAGAGGPLTHFGTSVAVAGVDNMVKQVSQLQTTAQETVRPKF